MKGNGRSPRRPPVSFAQKYLAFRFASFARSAFSSWPAARDRDDARAERRGVLGGFQELGRLSRQGIDDDELLLFYMARDFLHDERVAVLEDVDADELQLQREFFRDELRQAAQQQVDAVGAADFLHGREDRVDGEMVDRVRDLELRKLMTAFSVSVRCS